ncbi:MAG: HEPN domain-containing protein [Thermoanaerobaculia bacterium]
MPDPEHVLEVVREWVTKAESDLTAAKHLVQLGEEGPCDAACFHAQQTVEKYLKALLVSEHIDFPKTHDCEQLMALISEPVRPTLTIEEQGEITEYAWRGRYPGFAEISLTEARRAIEIAQRVRDEVREKLSQGLQ